LVANANLWGPMGGQRRTQIQKSKGLVVFYLAVCP